MDTFDFDASEPKAPSTQAIADIDAALTAQIAVAWAGESGDDGRLGWWRSDLVSTYGGYDLFSHLLPNTSQWAVLQGAREAARRKDAELRARDHNPDRLLSLFNLGFEVDERLDERLYDLKVSESVPEEALPELKLVVQTRWQRQHFLEWVRTHGEPPITKTPTGRRLRGPVPGTLGSIVKALVGALAPLADEYPLPHYVREVT